MQQLQQLADLAKRTARPRHAKAKMLLSDASWPKKESRWLSVRVFVWTQCGT